MNRISNMEPVTIISATAALGTLVGKATSCIDDIPSRWYIGSKELKAFPGKVIRLRAIHEQWTSQLRRHGINEDHHLAGLIEQAEEILTGEEKHVLELKNTSLKSSLTRLKRRAFPGELGLIFDEILEIVNAAPQHIKTRVDNFELLERNASQTPVTLRFPPDRKYVPLPGPFTKVLKALEDADGLSVVTVHGVAGMGKTSLVKYVALHYQRKRKPFSDGVYYLDCGKGAEDRVEQLRLALLDDLGCGVGSAGESSGSKAPEQKANTVPSHQSERKLRFRLAQQKLLIVIDDVWETKVLEELLVHEAELKYLISSQFRTIWPDAEMIELGNPDHSEATQIMANHTQGLQPPGEFPESIQSQIDDIMGELHYHPLSLANVAISINRAKATDAQEWKAAKEKLRTSHMHDDFPRSPMAYGRTYPHTVDTSMMVMVDSLPPVAKRLLWVMALLGGEEWVPEEVVKYFYSVIEPSNSKYSYNNYLTELEDRSLLTLHCLPQDESFTHDRQSGMSSVALHGLRAHFLRERNGEELRAMVTDEILGGSSDSAHAESPTPMSFRGLLSRMITWGGMPPSMPSEDPPPQEQTFVTIMAAMYFEKSFRNLVRTKLQTDLIPRMTSKDMDVIPLMQFTEACRETSQALLSLLNPGEGGWPQQAEGYAKQVVIKFAVRGELDDQSMARLIQLPHSTFSACQALVKIMDCLNADWGKLFTYGNRTFSEIHRETMKSLLTSLLHDNATTTAIRVAVIDVLSWILPLESEDSIVRVARKWVGLLATDSNRAVQSAVVHAIYTRTVRYALHMRSDRKAAIMGEFPGIVEGLLLLAGQAYIFGKRDQLEPTNDAWEALLNLSSQRSSALKMVTIPGAAELFFERFLLTCSSPKGMRSWEDGCYPRIMLNLSSIPENRVRFRVLLNGLTRLVCEYDRANHRIAEILGNLALTKEIRETIAKIAHVHDWLREVQHLHGAQLQNQLTSNRLRWLDWPNFVECVAAISRAKTILEPFSTNPPEAAATDSLVVRESVSYAVYKGRAEAFQNMKRYSEALVDLGIAHHHLQQLLAESQDEEKYVDEDGQNWPKKAAEGELNKMETRDTQLFLKAMTEDYEGATLDADNWVNMERGIVGLRFTMTRALVGRGLHRRLSGHFAEALATRGVLRTLSGHFTEALADLDEALSISKDVYDDDYIRINYDILRHRGYVKWLMVDEMGATADAEAAQDVKIRKLLWETSLDAMGPSSLRDLPVNYFGFTFHPLGNYYFR